jgi:hypothetical protein
MRPGTRVTSHAFTMGEWEPDEQASVEYRTAYLWIVPARVGGNWTLRDGTGGTELTIALNQSFQKVGGEATVGGRKQSLMGVSLQGDTLRFSFNDAKGVTRHFTGTVRGTVLGGTLRAAGTADLEVSGSAQGALAAAPWTDMADGCGRFYGK